METRKFQVQEMQPSSPFPFTRHRHRHVLPKEAWGSQLKKTERVNRYEDIITQ